jgi:hypothetical protein
MSVYNNGVFKVKGKGKVKLSLSQSTIPHGDMNAKIHVFLTLVLTGSDFFKKNVMQILCTEVQNNNFAP